MRLNSMADYEALRHRDTRRITPVREILRPYIPSVPLSQRPIKPNPRGRHEPGKMNKTEQFFAADLDLCKKAGEIRDWKFEAIRLTLADRCTYTPDFCVEMANGDLVMVEVKRVWKGKRGPHWEDDARAKIKFAAKEFREWFQFYGVHWDGGKWVYEVF